MFIIFVILFIDKVMYNVNYTYKKHINVCEKAHN